MPQKKPLPDADHYCNEPLRCWTCVLRFWAWAENYSHRFERPLGKRRQEAARAREEIAHAAEVSCAF